MSYLSEFLLARIAEDEAPTWALLPYECEPGCCAPEGWVGSQCRYCDPAPAYGGTVEAITRMAEEHAEAIHQRSRVLAECEAKRRIVALSQKLKGPDPGDWTTDDREFFAAEGSAGALEWTLRLLALPYADHPDYRNEWRP